MKKEPVSLLGKNYNFSLTIQHLYNVSKHDENNLQAANFRNLNNMLIHATTDLVHAKDTVKDS